jgi:hypothetical protein
MSPQSQCTVDKWTISYVCEWNSVWWFPMHGTYQRVHVTMTLDVPLLLGLSPPSQCRVPHTHHPLPFALAVSTLISHLPLTVALSTLIFHFHSYADHSPCAVAHLCHFVPWPCGGIRLAVEVDWGAAGAWLTGTEGLVDAAVATDPGQVTDTSVQK